MHSETHHSALFCWFWGCVSGGAPTTPTGMGVSSTSNLTAARISMSKPIRIRVLVAHRAWPARITSSVSRSTPALPRVQAAPPRSGSRLRAKTPSPVSSSSRSQRQTKNRPFIPTPPRPLRARLLLMRMSPASEHASSAADVLLDVTLALSAHLMPGGWPCKSGL